MIKIVIFYLSYNILNFRGDLGSAQVTPEKFLMYRILNVENTIKTHNQLKILCSLIISLHSIK